MGWKEVIGLTSSRPLLEGESGSKKAESEILKPASVAKVEHKNDLPDYESFLTIIQSNGKDHIYTFTLADGSSVQVKADFRGIPNKNAQLRYNYVKTVDFLTLSGEQVEMGIQTFWDQYHS